MFHLASMKFLAEHNFDFNKLFYEGIPYLSKTQIENIQNKKHFAKLKKELLRLNTTVSPDMKAFYQQHITSI